jgi:hypothetical protein
MTEKTITKSATKPKRALLSQAVHLQQSTIITDEAVAKTSQRTGRVGTRMLGGHISEPAQRQFKILAVVQDKTVQALLEEAINDLFRKYGKEPIA